MYIPRPSTIFHQQWQAQRKSLIQDIKAGKIDVDVVYSIMEAESISVEKMDSIMGDSLWRRFMEGSTNGKR